MSLLTSVFLQSSGTYTVTTRVGAATEQRVYYWKPAGGPFTVCYSLAAEDAKSFLSQEPVRALSFVDRR